MKQETARQKRDARLTKLILACAEHFSEDEMLEVFENVTGKEYVEKKDTNTMVWELSLEGYGIFKPDSTSKADQLKEYAETVVFPYCNEQQVSILF